jgi:hypothetical protein
MEHRFGLTRQLCRCAFEYLSRRPTGSVNVKPPLPYAAFETRLLQAGAVLAQHAGRGYVDCADVAVAMRLQWRVDVATLLLDPGVRAEWRTYLQMRARAAATTLQRREEAFRAQQVAAETAASQPSFLPRSNFVPRAPSSPSNPDDSPADQHAMRMSRLILPGGDAPYTDSMQKAWRGLSRLTGATVRPFQPRSKVVKDCLTRCQPTVGPTAVTAATDGGGGTNEPSPGAPPTRKPILSDFEQSQLWHEVWQHPSDEAAEGCADLWDPQKAAPAPPPPPQPVPVAVEEVGPSGTKKRGRKKAVPVTEAQPALAPSPQAVTGPSSGEDFQPRVVHLQGDIQLLRPVFVHQHLPRQVYSAHGAARSRQQRRREQRQLQRMRERHARLAAAACSGDKAAESVPMVEVGGSSMRAAAAAAADEDPVEPIGGGPGENATAHTGGRARMNESALALRALASLLVTTTTTATAVTRAATPPAAAHVLHWPQLLPGEEWFHVDAAFAEAWQQHRGDRHRARERPRAADARKAASRTPARTAPQQARGRSKTPKRVASTKATDHEVGADVSPPPRRTTRSKSRTSDEVDHAATAMVDVAVVTPPSPKHHRPLRRVLPSAAAPASAAGQRRTRSRGASSSSSSQSSSPSPPPPQHLASSLPNSARAKRRDGRSPEPSSTAAPASAIPFPVLEAPPAATPASVAPVPKRNPLLHLASVKQRRQLRLFD